MFRSEHKTHAHQIISVFTYTYKYLYWLEAVCTYSTNWMYIPAGMYRTLYRDNTSAKFDYNNVEGIVCYDDVSNVFALEEILIKFKILINMRLILNISY